MFKRAFIVIIFCLLLGSCAQQGNTEIPAWKTAYLKLINNTFYSSETLTKGIIMGYGIELIDYDNDGIPELQERYISASRGEYYYIWFAESDQAICIDTYPTDESPAGKNTGIYVNDEGEHIIYKWDGNIFYETISLYVPTDTKSLWEHHMTMRTGGITAGNPIYRISIDNETEKPISKQEYEAYRADFDDNYRQIRGELLPLQEPLFEPDSKEVMKIISDFFDDYDNAPSQAYKAMN